MKRSKRYPKGFTIRLQAIGEKLYALRMVRNESLQTVAERIKMSPRPMLSLDVSKSILNKYGITYTDEEIVIIREFMYRVAEITAAYYLRLKENDSKVMTLTQTDKDEKKSISIRSRVYRRAG